MSCSSSYLLFPHRMQKLMNRLLKTISMLEYFVNNSWEWSTNNTEMLLSELSPEDQRVSMALTLVHPGNSGLQGNAGYTDRFMSS